MSGKPTTIDEYLETIGDPQRTTLNSVRAKIHQIVPGLQECISYGMPAFRLNGRVIAGFQATKAGCSYYPFSGSTLASVAVHLVGYDVTKSALHFTSSKPLPTALVRTLLEARMAEIDSDGH